ncbi:APC family permease [Saccharopolyspora dendranthemae]|uniref:Amino acid exporter (AAE family) n=1 Tax=Saccharopolyspora dendranthemae TaxID=1181886 RepID=A0A561U7Q8_9PSEU|nr:amino acid permease [Saccharopolyspora dendranthemae]TWF95392.1 amino acid exporter (AAE family) [Saccharopolyspora dendranthemae]
MPSSEDRTYDSADRRIGVPHGVALYVGAILGAGVLTLPAQAARLAGPASILAWLALVLLCIPVAATFAALGAREPDSGGIATFVTRAFGGNAGAVVGWWFYFALPLGAAAVAYVGGQYVAHALSAGPGVGYLVGAIIVLTGLATNAAGLQVSGRVQLALIGLLGLLLLVTIAVALPYSEPANLTPFLPNGWVSVVRAAGVLFFTFAGWEAVTHLSAEFTDPRRDLPRITVATLITVGVLYLGLATTCVLVLGTRLPTSSTPITVLLETGGMGGAARMLTGVLAFLLTAGVMNAYLAGGARLGAALARDGSLPHWLAEGNRPGSTPRRSLALLGAATTAVAIVALAARADLGDLMLAASACFMAVYVAGLCAGARLLPAGSAVRAGAGTAAVVMAIVLAFTGWFLLLPISLALAFMSFRLLTRHTPRRRPETVPPERNGAL